ncbi:hypothetical protein EMIT0357P_130104 [Pseudomonas marginalis]
MLVTRRCGPQMPDIQLRAPSRSKRWTWISRVGLFISVHPRRSGGCALWRRVVVVPQQVLRHADPIATEWIATADYVDKPQVLPPLAAPDSGALRHRPAPPWVFAAQLCGPPSPIKRIARHLVAAS